MAKFHFTWEQVPVQGAEADESPRATLGPGSIRLSAAAVGKLAGAEQVVLAYDGENRALAVRPWSGEENLKPYPFAARIRRDKSGTESVTLRCKPFMEKVRAAMNLDLSAGRLTCPATYNSRSGMLIIQVSPDPGEEVEL